MVTQWLSAFPEGQDRVKNKQHAAWLTILNQYLELTDSVTICS